MVTYTPHEAVRGVRDRTKVLKAESTAPMETFRGGDRQREDLLSSLCRASRPTRMGAGTGLYSNPHMIHKNRENFTCVLSTVTSRAPTRFLLHCHCTEKPPKLHKVPPEARGNPTKKSPKSILQIL